MEPSSGPRPAPVTPLVTEGGQATGKRAHEETPPGVAPVDPSTVGPSPKKKKTADGSPLAVARPPPQASPVATSAVVFPQQIPTVNSIESSAADVANAGAVAAAVTAAAAAAQAAALALAQSPRGEGQRVSERAMGQRRAAAEAAMAAQNAERERLAMEKARAAEEARRRREWEREEKKRLAAEAREAEKARKQREKEEAKRLREEEKARKKEEARLAREAAAKERARLKAEEKERKAVEKAKKAEEDRRQREAERERKAAEKAKRLEEEKRQKEERKAAKIAEKKRLQEEAEREKLEAARAAEELQKKQWSSWGFAKPTPERLPPITTADQTLADSPVKAVVLQRHLAGTTVRAKLQLKQIDRTAFDQAVRAGTADVKTEFVQKCKEMKAVRSKQPRKGSPVPAYPKLSCMKLLAFHGNNRPPYYGTMSRPLNGLRLRNPFVRAEGVDYEVDSDDEWEEDAEDIEKSDGEEDLEEEDEEGDFIVPDDYLSDDERGDDPMDTSGPSKTTAVKKRETAGAPKAVIEGISFSPSEDSALCSFAVNLLPDVDVPPSTAAKEKKPKASASDLPEEQLRKLVGLLHGSTTSRPAIIAQFREAFPEVKKQTVKNVIIAISTRASSRAAIQVNKEVYDMLGMDAPAAPVVTALKAAEKKASDVTAVTKTIAKKPTAKKRQKQAQLPGTAAAQAKLVVLFDDECGQGAGGGGVGGVVGLSATHTEAKEAESAPATQQSADASPVAILVPKKKPKRVAPTLVTKESAPQISAVSSPAAVKESTTEVSAAKAAPITAFFGKPKENS